MSSGKATDSNQEAASGKKVEQNSVTTPTQDCKAPVTVSTNTCVKSIEQQMKKKLLRGTQSSPITTKEEMIISNKYNTKFVYHLNAILEKKVKDGSIKTHISGAAYQELTKNAHYIAQLFMNLPNDDEDFVIDYNTQLKIHYFAQRMGRFAEREFLKTPQLAYDIIGVKESLELLNIIDGISGVVVKAIEKEYRKSIADILFDAVGAVYYKSNIPEIVQAIEINCVNLVSDVTLAADDVIKSLTRMLNRIATDVVLDTYLAMCGSEAMMIDKVTKGVAKMEL